MPLSSQISIRKSVHPKQPRGPRDSTFKSIALEGSRCTKCYTIFAEYCIASLRTLKAVVDTGNNKIWIDRFKREVPLHLTDRGLYLIDINDLRRSESSETASIKSSAADDHDRIFREVPMQKETSSVRMQPVQTTCFNDEVTHPSPSADSKSFHKCDHDGKDIVDCKGLIDEQSSESSL